MSLGIAFKGPEGIVLAADSRVTLTGQLPTGVMIQSSYDNATKLLRVKGQDFVGVVTFGAGAIGQSEPRTAHSFLPEFEAEVAHEGRLPVELFAQRLSDYFTARWADAGMPVESDPMVFIVGGYDEPDAVYGRIFEFSVPSSPAPSEKSANAFGLTFGGQAEIVQRILGGFDMRAIPIAQGCLGLNDVQVGTLQATLGSNLALGIPYQFLPLQDCVDLAIFLIRSTAMLHKWIVGLRGVGGAIDVATITRTEGFHAVQSKAVRGE